MPFLVEYDLVFLQKSWEWLNDPELKALTLTPDFSKQDQQRFYESLCIRKDYWIKGIEEEGKPVGAMGLKHITNRDAEYWGYIGERNYWGKGIGAFMIKQAKDKARQLSLSSIYLRVSSGNERAKRLYEKMGFQKTEEGPIEKYEMTV
ncbi:MAG: GNAT family N-acetyltransferase [Chitinophagaceae bacterium]|nr:MAG: GNAT family N-acetyltransferase [Chitinophagaceae bacterium]